MFISIITIIMIDAANTYVCIHICIYVEREGYTYTYIYIYRERDR